MPEERRSQSGAPGDKVAGAHRLRQLASERILSASNLTDELTDDEARPLIDWGVMQAEAAADDLSQVSLDERDPAGSDLGDILAERLEAVRRMMKRMNHLVVGRHALPAEEVLGELQRLFELAENLPRPPFFEEPAVPLAELSARQAGLGNRAFVQAIVGLLDASSWDGEEDRSAGLGRGE